MRIRIKLIMVVAIIYVCFTYLYGQTQFDAHSISNNAMGAWSVFAIDIDGDTDIDILSASMDDNKIAWYENDGNQNFTPHIIIDDAEWPLSGYPVDLDLDYDIDAIFCELVGKKIRWCESDGNQNFTSHTIATSVLMYTSVYPVDLDEDNDIDILTTSVDDDINVFKLSGMKMMETRISANI